MPDLSPLNAESHSNFLQLGRKSGAGHSRQFTPGGYLSLRYQASNPQPSDC